MGPCNNQNHALLHFNGIIIPIGAKCMRPDGRNPADSNGSKIAEQKWPNQRANQTKYIKYECSWIKFRLKRLGKKLKYWTYYEWWGCNGYLHVPCCTSINRVLDYWPAKVKRLRHYLYLPPIRKSWKIRQKNLVRYQPALQK